jgi:pimeloyl-ACP methyl ester carboxylesterase
MPLAASRERAVRFVVAFAGPAVTADEVDLFQDLAGEGERPPSLSDDEITARVEQAGPGGIDPLPWIRALRVPALWLYGGLDRHISTELSMRRLRPLLGQDGRDFSAEVFPHANHALVETRTGLTSEMLASSTFAPGLFSAVADWLREHRLSTG